MPCKVPLGSSLCPLSRSYRPNPSLQKTVTRALALLGMGQPVVQAHSIKLDESRNLKERIVSQKKNDVLKVSSAHRLEDTFFPWKARLLLKLTIARTLTFSFWSPQILATSRTGSLENQRDIPELCCCCRQQSGSLLHHSNGWNADTRAQCRWTLRYHSRPRWCTLSQVSRLSTSGCDGCRCPRSRGDR